MSSPTSSLNSIGQSCQFWPNLLSFFFSLASFFFNVFIQDFLVFIQVPINQFGWEGGGREGTGGGGNCWIINAFCSRWLFASFFLRFKFEPVIKQKKEGSKKKIINCYHQFSATKKYRLKLFLLKQEMEDVLFIAYRFYDSKITLVYLFWNITVKHFLEIVLKETV